MKKLLKEEQLIQLIENIISEISNKTKSQYIKKSLERGDSLGKHRVERLLSNYLDKEIDREKFYEFYEPSNQIVLVAQPESGGFYIEDGDLFFEFYPDQSTPISKLGSNRKIKITLKDIHDYRPFLGNNQVEVNRPFAILASRVINMLRGVEDNFSPYGEKQYNKDSKLKTFFKNLIKKNRPIKPTHFKIIDRDF